MPNKDENIPKKVHLIWFGNQSEFSFDLSSLRKYMPNYEVKVWTEKDFDWDELKKIKYVKKAYNGKKWAFLSDYLRAKILYEEGGVYLDADMKIIKNIEEYFSTRSLVMAFENSKTISMGIVGVKKGHKIFRDIMSIYESYKHGKYILGNVIWDYIAKRELDIKINGRFQDNNEDWVIYEYRRFSLIHPRYRKWKRDTQYTLHQHTITWVPKKYRGIFKFLVGLTQKLPFLNKAYGLVLIWPKKQMRKNYVIK